MRIAKRFKLQPQEHLSRHLLLRLLFAPARHEAYFVIGASLGDERIDGLPMPWLIGADADVEAFFFQRLVDSAAVFVARGF